MDYRINFDADQARLQRMYKLTPRAMRGSVKKSINAILPKYQRLAGGQIPRDAGSSVTGYRKVRSRRRLAKGAATLRRLRAEVWQGTARIPAKYAAGKLKQTKRGVRAGRLFFDGAFLATMKNGYTGVFRRTGVGRKIEQEYIYLDNARAIVERLSVDFRRDLREVLEDEVRKTWNRTVR